MPTSFSNNSELYNISFYRHCTKNETVDLVTFTEEILNGKLHFLYSERNFGFVILKRKAISLPIELATRSGTFYFSILSSELESGKMNV